MCHKIARMVKDARRDPGKLGDDVLPGPFAVDQYGGQVGVSLFGVCYRNTFLASSNRSLEPRLSTLVLLR